MVAGDAGNREEANMDNPVASDIVFEWLPLCSAGFPLCNILVSVLPVPTGISPIAASALACVFCLLVVGFVSVAARGCSRYAWSIAVLYCVIGSVVAPIVLLAFVIPPLQREVLVFTSTLEYVGFFCGLSYLFAFIKHAGKFAKLRRSTSSAQTRE